MKYLEGTLKLKANRDKSRTVSVFAIRDFKYFGRPEKESMFVSMEKYGKKSRTTCECSLHGAGAEV